MSAEPRTATVRAARSGTLYVLTKKDLHTTLERFPGLEGAIRSHMAERETVRRGVWTRVTIGGVWRMSLSTDYDAFGVFEHTLQ